MNSIADHVQMVCSLLRYAERAADEALPQRGADVDELVADMVVREAHRDTVMQLFLPIDLDTRRFSVSQKLSGQASNLRERLDYRKRIAERRANARRS